MTDLLKRSVRFFNRRQMRRSSSSCIQKSVGSSLLFDKLLAAGVGVGSSPAASALPVSDVEAGGTAVNVVLAERRTSGHVVRVEDVGLLTSFAGESLLRETLILHQLRVVAVFPSLRKGQCVLKHTNTRSVQLCALVLHSLLHSEHSPRQSPIIPDHFKQS